MVATFFPQHDRADVLALCDLHEVPVGPIYDIADIFADPHYAARGDLFRTETRAGEMALPASVPRMSRTPAAFRHAGRALGADTDRILTELLGLSPDELDSLKRKHAI